ncbi:hypothetical protein OHT93_02100 [Streptomyces sp. NBC_00191]
MNESDVFSGRTLPTEGPWLIEALPNLLHGVTKSAVGAALAC